MSEVNSLSAWINLLTIHFSVLTTPQITVLAMWSYAISITQKCGLTTISAFLAMAMNDNQNTVRQRLREWYYEKERKRGQQRQEVDVTVCFAPLLIWILSLWTSGRLVLALDATTLDDRFVALVISVVYRGCATPVAWAILPANKKGAWKAHWLRLLGLLNDAIPSNITVLVQSDRGLYARWLYQAIQKNGWHPFMRINLQGKIKPDGTSEWIKLSELVPAVGRQWRGKAQVFVSNPLTCTVLARWDEGYDDPWVIVTDLTPEVCDACWYALRAWIEQGFKCYKSGGLQWQYTRVEDPKRIERLWLPMAVASVWLLAVGTEAELANDEVDIPEWSSILPLELKKVCRRTIRVFRRGWLQILAWLVTGKTLKMPTKLIPEKWPPLQWQVEAKPG